jgi:23S rRNA A2030 N6-methylase RlmJ
MAMAMAHDARVDWEKVNSSLPVDDGSQQIALKPFFKKAKKYSKLLVALTEVLGTQATGTSD